MEPADELTELVAALSDTARTARAQRQLIQLVRTGGASTVLGLLLDRLIGSNGVRGAGARRAVARLLEEAIKVAGKDGLPHLPKLVSLSSHALGDGEATVRDSFTAALASAARAAGGEATGRQLLNLLIRPLLKLVDGRTSSLQLGGSQALCEVVRVLQPPQLRPCAPALMSALLRHLKGGCTQGRPSLLDCAGVLVLAVPEACMAINGDHLLDCLPVAMQAAKAAEWRERLASVHVLEALARATWRADSGIGAAQRVQVVACIKTLKVDKTSLVRDAAAAAYAACERPNRPATITGTGSDGAHSIASTAERTSSANANSTNAISTSVASARVASTSVASASAAGTGASRAHSGRGPGALSAHAVKTNINSSMTGKEAQKGMNHQLHNPSIAHVASPTASIEGSPHSNAVRQTVAALEAAAGKTLEGTRKSSLSLVSEPSSLPMPTRTHDDVYLNAIIDGVEDSTDAPLFSLITPGRALASATTSGTIATAPLAYEPSVRVDASLKERLQRVDDGVVIAGTVYPRNPFSAKDSPRECSPQPSMAGCGVGEEQRSLRRTSPRQAQTIPPLPDMRSAAAPSIGMSSSAEHSTNASVGGHRPACPATSGPRSHPDERPSLLRAPSQPTCRRRHSSIGGVSASSADRDTASSTTPSRTHSIPQAPTISTQPKQLPHAGAARAIAALVDEHEVMISTRMLRTQRRVESLGERLDGAAARFASAAAVLSRHVDDVEKKRSLYASNYARAIWDAPRQAGRAFKIISPQPIQEETKAQNVKVARADLHPSQSESMSLARRQAMEQYGQTVSREGQLGDQTRDAIERESSKSVATPFAPEPGSARTSKPCSVWDDPMWDGPAPRPRPTPRAALSKAPSPGRSLSAFAPANTPNTPCSPPPSVGARLGRTMIYQSPQGGAGTNCATHDEFASEKISEVPGCDPVCSHPSSASVVCIRTPAASPTATASSAVQSMPRSACAATSTSLRVQNSSDPVVTSTCNSPAPSPPLARSDNDACRDGATREAEVALCLELLGEGRVTAAFKTAW